MEDTEKDIIQEVTSEEYKWGFTTDIDTETIRKVMKIIGILEEDEDVTNVYHDMEIPDDFEEE